MRACLSLLCLTSLLAAGCERYGFEPEDPDRRSVRFSLVDLTTGRTDIAIGPEIGVVIDGAGAWEFLITEEPTRPSQEHPGWVPAFDRWSPSAVDGMKWAYLWMRSAPREISDEPLVASIIMVTGVIAVGPTANACANEPAARCAVSSTDVESPVQAAVDAASPGDEIVLYGEAGAAMTDYFGDVRIEHSLTIRAAPGFAGRVRIVGSCDAGSGVIQIGADGVTLSDLGVVVRSGCQHGINTSNSQFGGSGNSGQHLFERLALSAISVPFGASNSITDAFVIGNETTVRNTVVTGWFEGAFDVHGGAGDSADNVFLVHNTVIQPEQDPVVYLSSAIGVVIRNNLFVGLSHRPGPAIDGSSSTSGTIAENNVVWGFGAVAEASIPAGFNIVAEPGVVSMVDPRPAQGSVLIDAGSAEPDAGSVDHTGAPRVVGSAPDIGAFEEATQLNPLVSPVRVGTAPNACPVAVAGACDFFPTPAQPQALSTAMAAAPSNAVVELYPDTSPPTRMEAADVIISRPLTVRVAPGYAPGDVVLFNGTSTNRGMLVVAYADGVTVESLAFECDGCSYPIWFDRGGSSVDGESVAENGVVDRCLFSAVSASSVQAPVRLSGGGTLSNSVGWGMWESLVTVDGIAASAIGNTWFSREPGSSAYAFLLLDRAVDFLAANNLLVATGVASQTDTVAVVGSSSNTGSVWRNNAFYGFATVGTSDVGIPVPSSTTPGTNCHAEALASADRCAGTDPRFVAADNDDFHLASGSPGIDAGDSAMVTSGFDLDGQARVLGASVDLGAYER